jgi:hypothetical protein
MSAEAPSPNRASSAPHIQARPADPPRTLNTHRTFPTFRTRQEWEARRAFIREQMLVSLGLYPLPPRPPLKARIFDRVERDGYTIEKVYFQTHPGFYLAGNLYRPLENRGQSVPNQNSITESRQYPGVLVAHGHWGEGRMANKPEGSIAARAITFARQGYVAFTYDMVGYNDTRQINHQFANDLRHWLWGVSLMGLQTWNSMRALDFLSSLPDVDPKRLAITGESGGGTQTMILGALEDRLAAVAPCVMVSHTMQGGCLCENAPGLRVDFSNVEVAAAAAPKYQIIVGATGDWTKTTQTMEGPSVESIYKLLGVPNRVRYVTFDYGHNINQTSREAVYAFFGEKLLGVKDTDKLKEPPYQMEPVEKLRVFPEGAALPPDAKTADQLTDYLMAVGQEALARRKPRDKRSLTLFKKTFRPMWERTLALDPPQIASTKPTAGSPPPSSQRSAESFSLSANLEKPQQIAILAHPSGMAALQEPKTGDPGPLVRALHARQIGVVLLDTFLTGQQSDPEALAARKVPFGQYFCTYNRTNLQERARDLVNACAQARTLHPKARITLIGIGEAGLWTLLAAPAADAVVADCAQLDLTTDDALLTDDLFVPGLRRLGDFATAATLAAPNRLLLHNIGTKFTAIPWISEVYKAIGAEPALRVEEKPLNESEIVDWIK